MTGGKIVFEIDLAGKSSVTYTVGQAIGALTMLVLLSEKLNDSQKEYLNGLIMTLEHTVEYLGELPLIKN